MKPPILRPGFVWFPAASHSDPANFAGRQKARIAAANVARLAKSDRLYDIWAGAGKDDEVKEAAIRG